MGDTWYDALQIKGTKRLSHGLTAVSTFAWQKTLTIGTERDPNPGTAGNALTNNVYNLQNNKYISGFDQPLVWNISINYTTPRIGGNKFLSWIVRDWTYGAFLQYASGLPIQAPYANAPVGSSTLNSLLFNAIPGVPASTGTFANRVPGVPLFTVDLNCHCYNPAGTFALNPAAWTNPPAGQFGTSAAYYSDYRYQRRPAENMSLARNFRFKESMNLQIRAEFTNIFNRTEPNNPTSTNAVATQTRVNGQTTGGFGYINNGTVYGAPRSGQLVARFQF